MRLILIFILINQALADYDALQLDTESYRQQFINRNRGRLIYTNRTRRDMTQQNNTSSGSQSTSSPVIIGSPFSRSRELTAPEGFFQKIIIIRFNKSDNFSTATSDHQSRAVGMVQITNALMQNQNGTTLVDRFPNVNVAIQKVYGQIGEIHLRVRGRNQNEVNTAATEITTYLESNKEIRSAGESKEMRAL